MCYNAYDAGTYWRGCVSGIRISHFKEYDYGRKQEQYAETA